MKQNIPRTQDTPQAQDTKHKRRVHYSGKYPKRFEENILTVKLQNFCTIDEIAAERLDTISEAEREGMLVENSDEPYAGELARTITTEIRKGHRIDTTAKLRRVIEDTLDFLPQKEKKDTVRKTCQRAFKAGYREGIYREIARDVVRPGAQECAANGRARSTRMRWAVRA